MVGNCHSEDFLHLMRDEVEWQVDNDPGILIERDLFRRGTDILFSIRIQFFFIGARDQGD